MISPPDGLVLWQLLSAAALIALSAIALIIIRRFLKKE